jgi:hypothetical protein
MSIKRKKNYDEAKHVEKPRKTSLSFLCLGEVEVFQPYSHPVHEVEEENGLNDEEFEDPIEPAPTSILPSHKDKEMVIFNHIDGLMKETLDMGDRHIDTFIQAGRQRWDFGDLIFDSDPIYDIKGSSQANGVEVSSSEEWYACVYDYIFFFSSQG